MYAQRYNLQMFRMHFFSWLRLLSLLCFHRLILFLHVSINYRDENLHALFIIAR